jgi:hypothetical protein
LNRVLFRPKGTVHHIMKLGQITMEERTNRKSEAIWGKSTANLSMDQFGDSLTPYYL